MRKGKRIVTILGSLALVIGSVPLGLVESSGLAYAQQSGARRPQPQKSLVNKGAPPSPRAQLPPEEREPIPPPEDDINPRRPNLRQIFRVLDLTPEQWLMVRQIHQRYGLKTQQVRDELEERQDAFNQAIFNEPYDAKLVEQRLQQVLEKQRELMGAQVEQERAFRGVLTPQQLDKFRELQARQMEIRRLQRAIREQQRQLNQEFQPNRR